MYDIIGDIAILKKGDKKEARKILKEQRNIKTVLVKVEKVKGRLRTIKTKWLAGEKKKETVYVESGCRIKLNVESCYFSPRLSGERLEIAGKCKKGEKILVLFGGVAPYAIVIAKKSKISKVVSVELGKECCRYARENVKMNKLQNVEIIQGDVRKVRLEEKFDRIVMPRPQLKETFLSYAFNFVKRGTIIYYYDFGKDIEKILSKIREEVKKARKKVKIFNFKKAGEIAPYKFRWRIDFKVV